MSERLGGCLAAGQGQPTTVAEEPMQLSTLETCTLSCGLYPKLLHKQLPAFPYEAVLLRGFFGRIRTLCLLFQLCLGDAACRGAISKEYVRMETGPCSAHVPGGPYGPALLFSIKRQKSWAIRKLLYSLLYLWIYTTSANLFITGNSSGVT